MTPEPTAAEIISFWREAGPKQWFRKDDAFDGLIRTRFEAAHHRAARGELTEWAEGAEGALALVLLLDQFPRNLYRGSAHAFATDGLARRIADRALARGFDQQTEEALRIFFYLPFEHSEDAGDQARSLRLFERAGDDEYTRYAKLHAEIIERFGRFPHRNDMLGRISTKEETDYLNSGGFAG
ncbi:MAG: DUF924 family protein [Pseudomonadota bacterium]|nr:DUF924 family protein [Pseudomonadota bacterium]